MAAINTKGLSPAQRMIVKRLLAGDILEWGIFGPHLWNFKGSNPAEPIYSTTVRALLRRNVLKEKLPRNGYPVFVLAT